MKNKNTIKFCSSKFGWTSQLLTTVSSSPFRSCLACSRLSCCTLQNNKWITACACDITGKQPAVRYTMRILRELLQLAALLLVDSLELLMLHPLPLLLQHDLLVQTAHIVGKNNNKKKHQHRILKLTLR